MKPARGLGTGARTAPSNAVVPVSPFPAILPRQEPPFHRMPERAGEEVILDSPKFISLRKLFRPGDWLLTYELGGTTLGFRIGTISQEGVVVVPNGPGGAETHGTIFLAYQDFNMLGLMERQFGVCFVRKTGQGALGLLFEPFNRLI